MEVGGQESLVHLTVENGSGETGEISIAVDLGGDDGENGHIEAHLQVKNNRIEGFLVGKTPQEVTKLQEASDIFYNLIREETWNGMRLEATKLPVVSSGNIHLTRTSGTESHENGELYHVAKLFLQAIR